MKSFRVVLILLIIPLILCSSTWTRFFEGTAYCVIEDHQGNYVLVGSNSYSGYGQQISVLKYDPEGNQIWNKMYGGTGDEGAFNILLTEDSGYIFSGYTTSSGSGLSDAYIMKLDSNGDSVWARVYGGVGEDSAFSISRTLDGGYIVGGTCDSLGYLLRLDTSGDTLWTRTYDSTNAIKYAISDDSAGVEWFICTVKYQTLYGDYPQVFRINTVGNFIWKVNLYHYFWDISNCKISKLSNYRYITATTMEGVWTTIPIYWIIDKNGNSILASYHSQNRPPTSFEDPLTNETNGDIFHSLTSVMVQGGVNYTGNYIYRYNTANDTLVQDLVHFYDTTFYVDFCVTADSSYIFVGEGRIMKTDYDGSLAVEEPITEVPSQNISIFTYNTKEKVICLSLAGSSYINLKIYDLQGRLVDIPLSGSLSPGTHQVPLQTERSGIYFYRLESSSGTETGKFMVVR